MGDSDGCTGEAAEASRGDVADVSEEGLVGCLLTVSACVPDKLWAAHHEDNVVVGIRLVRINVAESGLSPENGNWASKLVTMFGCADVSLPTPLRCTEFWWAGTDEMWDS